MRYPSTMMMTVAMITRRLDIRPFTTVCKRLSENVHVNFTNVSLLYTLFLYFCVRLLTSLMVLLLLRLHRHFVPLSIIQRHEYGAIWRLLLSPRSTSFIWQRRTPQQTVIHREVVGDLIGPPSLLSSPQMTPVSSGYHSAATTSTSPVVPPRLPKHNSAG